MDALIMSCSTGGGHNAAGYAVKEALEARGHRVTMLDPYTLVGKNLDKKVGNGYIKMAQKTPHLFGLVYKLGDEYRRLPIHSPVYAINKAMLGKMKEYLDNHHFDVILMPHVYPGEILAYMKNKGIKLPKLIFIATDYVCIPFTEETNCDYYITPSELLEDDFIRRGIPREKLVHTGIPVKRAFRSEISREEAIAALGLDSEKHYFLLSGGSIGAGKIGATIVSVLKYFERDERGHLIVICGNNHDLLEKLKAEYDGDGKVTLLASTDKMALYMKACDVYLSKPGGLSSTEAAVSGTPLIHIAPIPGCENKNMSFFEQFGMSIAVGGDVEKLASALENLRDTEFAERMREQQRKYINPLAAEEICDLAERITE